MKSDPLVVHAMCAYQGPAGVTYAEIEQRVERLEDFDQLLRGKDEIVRREDAVHNAEIMPGVPLWMALYDDCCNFPPDLRNALSGILDRTGILDAKDLVDNPARAETGLWPQVAGFICDEAQWIQFRRMAIVDYAESPEEFCNHVKVAFPRIVLSTEFPGCLETLEGGFERFVPVVVDALAALEDRLLAALGGLPIVEGLRQFSASSGFSTTMEGDADRNEALTFEFGKGDSMRKITCAPHMKLEGSLIRGDGKYYFNRIYFNPFQFEEGVVRIHVGHIGCHL